MRARDRTDTFTERLSLRLLFNLIITMKICLDIKNFLTFILQDMATYRRIRFLNSFCFNHII